MEPSTLRYGLLANHSHLILKLDTLAVLPFLVSDGLVSLDENETIQSKTTGGEKTDALLTLIHRKALSDGSAYERFLEILKDDFRSGGQQVQWLVTKVCEDAENPEVLVRYQAIHTGLDPRQKSALLSEEKLLVSSLNVEDVLADLVSLGVLSLDENEVHVHIHVQHTALPLLILCSTNKVNLSIHVHVCTPLAHKELQPSALTN